MRNLKILEHISLDGVAEGTPARSFELVATNAMQSGIIFST